MSRYYLAYGSNLHRKEMSQRCPEASCVGRAVLENYSLHFRGEIGKAYLTIEMEEGQRVPVGVWEVSALDEEALDRYEDFPHLYLKHELELEFFPLEGGPSRKIRAFLYRMREGEKLNVPSEEYVARCLQGYHDFGFDEAPFHRAKSEPKAEL